MVSSVSTNVGCDLRRAPNASTRIMCLAVLGLRTVVVLESTFVRVLHTSQACVWVPRGGAIAAGHSLCPTFVFCRFVVRLDTQCGTASVCSVASCLRIIQDVELLPCNQCTAASS